MTLNHFTKRYCLQNVQTHLIKPVRVWPRVWARWLNRILGGEKAFRASGPLIIKLLFIEYLNE